MKRILIIFATVFAIMFSMNCMAISAETTQTLSTEAKVPKFISFNSKTTNERVDQQKNVIHQAQDWLNANYKDIQVISHSLTYSVEFASLGFYTLTILYTEK